MLSTLLIGEIARRFGVSPWQVRKTILRGFLSEPQRLGPFRAFSPDDLPAIEAALKQAGYLPAQSEPLAG